MIERCSNDGGRRQAVVRYIRESEVDDPALCERGRITVTAVIWPCAIAGP